MLLFRPLTLALALAAVFAASDARRLGSPSGTTIEIAPGMGENNPIGTPKSVVCPINREEAEQTTCSQDNTGICFYNYRYKGCTYDKLKCVQDYSCDCQSFMANKEANWRCWGGNDSEQYTCPASAPTSHLVGQMCNPKEPVPQDPNPPAPQCPATLQDAKLNHCEQSSIPLCEYGFHEFTCNSGPTKCVPTHKCYCNGSWDCTPMQYYCPEANEEGEAAAVPFTTCTP